MSLSGLQLRLRRSSTADLRWENKTHLEVQSGVAGHEGRSVAETVNLEEEEVCCDLQVHQDMGGLAVAAQPCDIAGEEDKLWDIADGMEVRFEAAVVARRIADGMVVNSTLATVDGERSRRPDEVTFLSVLEKGCRLNQPFETVEEAVAVLAERD